MAHELFCRLPPNGGYSNDPSDIVIDYSRGRLVRQFLKAVVLEEAKCMSKHFNRPQLLPVSSLDFQPYVQVLEGGGGGGM